MRKFLLFSVGFCLAYYAKAQNLSTCGTDKTLEVIENKGDNLLTCRGLPSSDKAVWYLQTPNNPAGQSLGECDSDLTCVPTFASAFKLDRPSGTISTVTVNATNSQLYPYFQGTSILCRANAQTNDQGDTCQLDLVVVPVTKSCNIRYNTGTSTSWTVTANCSVTGVSSYLDRYKCRLVQTSPSQQDVGSEVTYSPTGGSGSCEVTGPFPSTTGNHSYQMAIVPGRVNVTANFEGESSSFQINRPSSAPTHTCAVYVEEGTNVVCTCSSSDLGQPAGVVKWVSSGSAQLSLNNINKNQNGTHHVCEVVWNGVRVQSVTYTLQVAYGPSSASVTTSSSLPFDTNGSLEMIITCSAQDVNPTPTFTWLQRSDNSVIVQGTDNSVKFTPRVPDDDNSPFECRVQNPETSTSRSDSITVGLNYPPDTDPTITNTSIPSNAGGHLYQGDKVTLNCSVTGGKPISATTLTFTCPPKQGQTVVGPAGVSNSVTFNALNDSDHGTVCRCTTKWKQTNWYDRDDSVTLFVNTPPTAPVIEPPGTDYPPIATVTTSVTFTCNSFSPGRPAATYTWPKTQGGQTATDSQGKGTLTFNSVNKALNGTVISCRASNRYTENRNAVTDGTKTLEVYYHPEVTVKPATDDTTNQCVLLPSDPTQCVVTEGQKVQLQCTAMSNPAPADFKWSPGHANGSDLFIESANRTRHTGLYNCSVKTGTSGQSDGRLPLSGSGAFTVLVAYPASILSFTLPSTNTNVTVGVDSIVNLTCQAEGRPSPSMTLRRPNGHSISNVPKGTPSLTDETKQVTGQVTAKCQDTGLYTCYINNDVGPPQQRQVTIFVQCGPEKAEEDSTGGDKVEIPVVNFRTVAENFTVDFISYPAPHLMSVKHFNQRPNATSVGRSASQNTVAVMCLSASATSPNTTCHITVDNMTSNDAGFYQAVIGNDFGNLSITFEVKINATSSHGNGDVDVFPVAAVAGGIAGLLVIALIGVGVFLWNRRKASKDKDTSPLRNHQNGAENREEPEMTVNSIYGMPESRNEDDEDETMIVNTLYESSDVTAPRVNRAAQQGSAYEDVDVNNAGMVSSPRPHAEDSAAKSSAAEAVYSVVNKGKKPPPAPGTSSGDTGDVYAVVDKTKKKPADASATNKPKPTVKPKPAPKKPEEPKGKGKEKKKDKKEGKQSQKPEETPEGAEYGNTALLPMAISSKEGTEYANFGFDGDDGGSHDDNQASGGQPAGRSVNADGLVYTTVVFTDEQRKAAKNPAPKRDTTDYVAIDFVSNMPPPPPPPDD